MKTSSMTFSLIWQVVLLPCTRVSRSWIWKFERFLDPPLHKFCFIPVRFQLLPAIFYKIGLYPVIMSKVWEYLIVCDESFNDMRIYFVERSIFLRSPNPFQTSFFSLGRIFGVFSAFLQSYNIGSRCSQSTLRLSAARGVANYKRVQCRLLWAGSVFIRTSK